MSSIATAVIGGAVIGGIATSNAADTAAGAQTSASNAQIASQERALAETRALLQPYVSAGDTALGSQMNLLGLGEGGYDAQQQAVQNISNDPLFQAQVRQGEEAMLQNASATGGLRGGNIQGALAQYRPQMLNQEIQQRMNRLGGIANLGQASAAGVGLAAQNGANNISNSLGQIGAAQAGNAVAQGQAISGITGNISNYAMMQGLGLFGGGTAAPMGGGFNTVLGAF